MEKENIHIGEFLARGKLCFLGRLVHLHFLLFMSVLREKEGVRGRGGVIVICKREGFVGKCAESRRPLLVCHYHNYCIIIIITTPITAIVLIMMMIKIISISITVITINIVFMMIIINTIAFTFTPLSQ